MPEINHKDKNVKNNNVDNLEWCDRKQNLMNSYETLSPTRNFRICSLFRESDESLIQSFHTILEASRYASEHFGVSESGMRKNYKSSGYYLRFEMCND